MKFWWRRRVYFLHLGTIEFLKQIWCCLLVSSTRSYFSMQSLVTENAAHIISPVPFSQLLQCTWRFSTTVRSRLWQKEHGFGYPAALHCISSRPFRYSHHTQNSFFHCLFHARIGIVIYRNSERGMKKGRGFWIRPQTIALLPFRHSRGKTLAGLWTAQGWIFTSSSVLRGGNSVFITFSGGRLSPSTSPSEMGFCTPFSRKNGHGTTTKRIYSMWQFCRITFQKYGNNGCWNTFLPKTGTTCMVELVFERWWILAVLLPYVYT